MYDLFTLSLLRAAFKMSAALLLLLAFVQFVFLVAPDQTTFSSIICNTFLMSEQERLPRAGMSS